MAEKDRRQRGLGKATLAMLKVEDVMESSVYQMGWLDGVQTTLVAKIDALISGRIEPTEKAVGQLVNDKQLRVQRTRWVVGTMIGTIGAGYTVLHALHVI